MVFQDKSLVANCYNNIIILLPIGQSALIISCNCQVFTSRGIYQTTKRDLAGYPLLPRIQGYSLDDFIDGNHPRYCVYAS